MARKLVVEVVADASQLERTFKRASSDATHLERSLSHASRGVAAGSGAFRHLGRSVAFASGGFVAFASATDFLRTSIDVARDAAVAQRQLAAQLKASGESFTANKTQIEQAGLSLEQFGFTSEDSAHALTVLERGTGSITRAIRLQGLAANLARAKNLDLAAAANTVAKVFGGQETALRRAVPGLEKTAHGMDLIRLAQQKLAGQAAAGTTEAQRFSATLHDTEVIIGTALLPTLDRALSKFSRWLTQLNRSGKLQRNLQSATEELGTAFGLLADAIGVASNAYDEFRDAAAKLPGGRGGFLSTLISGTLGAQLRSMADSGHKLGVELGFIADEGARAQGALGSLSGPVGPRAAGLVGPIGAQQITGLPGAVSGRRNAPLTAAQQFRIALAADPNNIALLRQQMQRDQAAIAFAGRLRARGTISNKKYVEEVTGYQNELTSAMAQINSITDQAASDAKKGRDAAARRLRQNIPAHVGGTAYGEFRFRPVTVPDVVTGRAAGYGAGFRRLREQYATPVRFQLAEAQAQALDQPGALLTALRAARTAARKALRSHRLSLQAQIDAWNEIASLNDQIKNAAKTSSDTYRKQRGRAVALAKAQGADYQFAYARGGPVVHIEHFHSSASNPRALEDELVKRARARPQVRRGAR